MWLSYLKVHPQATPIRKALQASYLNTNTLTTTGPRASLAPSRESNAASAELSICVDFADILALTLPRNARHFKNILVVTSPDDHATADVVKSVKNASLFTTDAFYRDGAVFNKGLAWSWLSTRWAVKAGWQSSTPTLFFRRKSISRSFLSAIYFPPIAAS